MRVLHLIASMDPAGGGPSQGIRNSQKALEGFGISREVACLDDPRADFLSREDIRVHALGPGKGAWRYSSRLLPWLYEHLSEYDVLIISGLWLSISYAGWKAVRRLRRSGRSMPYFVFPHGMLDPWFQHDPSRRAKAIRNRIYWSFIESKVVNEATGLFFTSAEEMTRARDVFPNYKPSGEWNTGYGIEAPPARDLAFYETLKRTIPSLQNRDYLLYFGRVHEKKGIDLLIQAYTTEILRRGMQPGIPALLIAGPSIDSGYGNQLKSMVPAEAADRVFFCDMLLDDAKWAAIYHCEALVLPSHQENFGIVVAEALACGKPVLISNKVNIWQAVRDGNAGLVAPDTVHGTSELLTGWFDSSETERRVMSENARKVYDRNFRVEEFARTLSRALISIHQARQ